MGPWLWLLVSIVFGGLATAAAFKANIEFNKGSNSSTEQQRAGKGGDASVGGNGIAIGGPGGVGGNGGNALVSGDGIAAGGEAGQTDRGGRSGAEIAGLPNMDLPNGKKLYDYGRGGDPGKIAQDKPEYKIIPVKSEDRIYFTQRPKQLMDQIKNLTELQAGLYVDQNFKGKWIRIEGPISNIRGDSRYAQIVFKIDGITTRMTLEERFISHVSHLNNGETVTVEGKLLNMNQGQLMFEQAALITGN